MKKLLVLILGVIVFVGCRKSDIANNTLVPSNLAINTLTGIKLQTVFVTGDVSMNIKSQTAQSVNIKIFDIANRVVSKSTSNINAGDNILTVYTSAFPPSAYRIGFYDSNGNMLGITDFNKIQ